MRGSIFLLLASFCLAVKNADFYNPVPKPDPVPPKRMPFLSRANNMEVWRLQNQIVHQGLENTQVVFAGQVFVLQKLTGGVANGAPTYVARMGEHESVPSAEAFVNLATKLINTGVIAANRVMGDDIDNKVFGISPVITPQQFPQTIWAVTNFDTVPGASVYSFLTVTGDKVGRFGFAVPDLFFTTAETKAALTTHNWVTMPSRALDMSLSIRRTVTGTQTDWDFNIFLDDQTTVNSVSFGTPNGCTSTTGVGCECYPFNCVAKAACDNIPASVSAGYTVESFANGGCTHKGRIWTNALATANKRLSIGTFDGKIRQLRFTVRVKDNGWINQNYLSNCATIGTLSETSLFNHAVPTRWCIKYDSYAQNTQIFVERFVPTL